MQLHLVKPAHYAGEAGILHVRRLQSELNKALAEENWSQVRRLDQACAVLIDKVIEANQEDKQSLAAALSELKGVYANLIVQCKREVASMAH
jgi:flagellar protein FliT